MTSQINYNHYTSFLYKTPEQIAAEVYDKKYSALDILKVKEQLNAPLYQKIDQLDPFDTSTPETEKTLNRLIQINDDKATKIREAMSALSDKIIKEANAYFAKQSKGK